MGQQLGGADSVIILLAGPTHIGIGIGIISNTNGDLWVTEMFSKP